MARRRRTRLTLRKRTRHKRVLTGGDPEAPTPAEWANMTKYGSFIIPDPDSDNPNDNHTFETRQVVFVLPDDCDPENDLDPKDYWFARIKEIRSRTLDDSDEEEVWVRVRWYWSPEGVAATIKSFDSSVCGAHELVFSDHDDIISALAISGHANVIKFDEDDIEQEFIDQDSFYSRFNFEYLARRLETKPGTNTCTCHQPYNPNDNLRDNLMHFCPRPYCRRFYHRACLVQAGSVSTNASGDRDLQLMTCWPDTNDVVSLAELSPVPRSATRKRRKSGDVEVHQYSDDEILASLPPDLVKIASQPIVRGAAFVKGKIVGNIKAVTSARRIIYETVKDGLEVPDDWNQQVGGKVGDAIVDPKILGAGGRGKKIVLVTLLCPGCNSPV